MIRLFLFLMMISTVCYGVRIQGGLTESDITDMSGVTLPIAYAETTDSKKLIGVEKKTHIEVINFHPTDNIGICYTKTTAAACTSDDMIVPANTGIWRDNAAISDNVYARSRTGIIINSDDLIISVW